MIYILKSRKFRELDTTLIETSLKRDEFQEIVNEYDELFSEGKIGDTLLTAYLEKKIPDLKYIGCEDIIITD